MSKHVINKLVEAKRYFNNAEKEYKRLKLDEFGFFSAPRGKDVRKSVRKAGHLFFVSALEALEYLFEQKNVMPVITREATKNLLTYKEYRVILNELKKKADSKQSKLYAKLLAELSRVYQAGYKSLGYDGASDVNIYILVKNACKNIIDIVEQLTKQNACSDH